MDEKIPVVDILELMENFILDELKRKNAGEDKLNSEIRDAIYHLEQSILAIHAYRERTAPGSVSI